ERSSCSTTHTDSQLDAKARRCLRRRALRERVVLDRRQRFCFQEAFFFYHVSFYADRQRRKTKRADHYDTRRMKNYDPSEAFTMAEIKSDITRNVLAVLFLVTLIGASIWILRPFLGAVVWAGTIVVATWPLMIAIQARLWGRRWLAVAAMTILLLAVL